MRGSVKTGGKPPLFDTLSVFLPTREETWLLRACTQEVEAGRVAWRSWREYATNVKEVLARDQHGVKSLLPLLYRALQRNGATVDAELLPYLRTAYFREELRVQAYRRICQEVLTTLREAGIRVLVLGGAALAETVYGEPALRHCGGVELLVEKADVPHAASLLVAGGFSRSGARSSAERCVNRLKHASGLPVEIRWDLFACPYYQAPLEDMWTRSLTREIAGVSVSLLAPADMLVTVFGRALCSGGLTVLQWVCDAWYVLDRCTDLDWDVLADEIQRARLALPASVMLSYLAEDLGALVPSFVLRQLADDGSRTTVEGDEAALFAARVGGRSSFRDLLRRSSSWRAKAVVLRWMLLPSPRYLRWTYPVHSAWLLPFRYLWRPLRYVVRRTQRAVGTAGKPSTTARSGP